MKTIVGALGVLLAASFAQAQITIKATNKLPIARANQTVELTGKELAGLNARDLMTVHVMDSAGKEVLAQAVDTDFDARHTPDIVIFQSDFGPGESKTFSLSVTVNVKQVFTLDQAKAHGRFVRERFDDFAWENDRIAHRMYGKWLETWQGEPLTSSSVDIWSKRTPKMVIDQWYMVDNYHEDTGEGADFYTAGATRGDGANGLWANNQLYVSKNFVNSRVLANGPIRVMFELDYDAFDVNGKKVAETKRITLDAGSNLDHFQSTYKPESAGEALVSGIGLKKTNGQQKDFNAEKGILTAWEPVEKRAGNQGLALIVDPKQLDKQTEDRANSLLLVKAPQNNTVSYWAGFFWDKSGQFASYDAWKAYVDQTAQTAASPIEVTVGK